MFSTVSCLLFLALTINYSASFNLDECTGALGMEHGAIKDEDINASSSYIEASVGPTNARLNKEMNGGAWCPKPQISENVTEYLEINLRDMHVITEVATQGRFGNGHGLEFAEDYKLEYWRPRLFKWIRYKNTMGQELLKGNTNTYTVVKRKLNPVIIASKIRFIPFSIHLRTICMRVEVHGCPWKDSLLSYSIPRGEYRGDDVNLSDMTYDGVKDHAYLYGGLGQLTDGIVGEDNFKLDVSGMGKGYEWVGWRSASRSVSIVFEFDQVRNFSSVRFHCNNMHTKSVQVFSSTKIWFSVGGKHFPGPPLHFSYVPDTFIERARDVVIPLRRRTGKFVRVELAFASKWILISEVVFVSVPAVGNFSEEDPPLAPPIVSTAVSEDALSNQRVGLVIGVLAAIILLLTMTIFLIITKKKKRKQNMSILKTGESSRVTVNMKDLELSYTPSLSWTGKTNGSIYNNSVVDSDSKLIAYRENGVTGVAPNTHDASANEFIFSQTPCEKTSSQKHYAVVKLFNVQDKNGTAKCARQNGELFSRNDIQVKEFPRYRLSFKEKLGEGQFGEVHLCETDYVPELVDIPCTDKKALVAVKSLRKTSSKQEKSDFFKETKILSKLSDPNIVHILGVCTNEEPFCVVVEYLEYGDLNQFLRRHVPEKAFISPHENNANKTLNYGSLIFMATQIASGMKYLESLNYVHRDLATRNCLVGQSLSIKVADFGVTRNLYSKDYYRIEGQAMLPIRWMAWESIFMGKFSTKSDVWAFAVTLWEILTFAKQQPYADQNDAKVIENASQFCNNDGRRTYLPQPALCPKEIYDLMKECWKKNEQDRPNFKDIHLFLQRRNLGFTP